MGRLWICIAVLGVLILQACDLGGSKHVRVITFNVRYGTADDGENSWENRKGILLDVLKKSSPDILGVQEALSFQIDAIKQVFPRYQAFGKGRYYGIEIPERPHESKSGESCNIFYDQSKLELLSQGTFWHSDFPDSAGSITWGNTLPRITTWGIFLNKETKKKFAIMNTHFHWGEPYVANTSRLMMSQWREVAGNLPTVIMGDFNLPPTSETHELFCGRSGSVDLRGRFSDCWQLLGKPEADAGTGHGFSGKGRTRIDWILITPEFQAKNVEIIHHNENGRYPSDHFPVVADLML